MLKMRAFVASAFLLVAFSAGAGTFVIPEDEVLIRQARDIVTGTVLESRSELTAEGGVRTITKVWVDRALAGELEPGQLIDVVEPGGATPELSLVLHGVPRFTEGERVLLMLVRNARGELATLHLALGKFSFRRSDRGIDYLLRDEGEICGWAPGFKPYRERARRSDGFLRYIGDVVAGTPGAPGYLEEYDQVCVSTGELTATPEALKDYSFCGCRWSSFGAGFGTFGTQDGIGDSVGAVGVGTSVWNSNASSSISYSSGGAASSNAAFNCSDGENIVVFNDPLNQIDGSFTASGGVVAIGGPCFGGSHSFGGETWDTIREGGVVVQDGVSHANGISQGVFEAVMAHELGHTLGFRHSDDSGAPNATSDALMNSFVNRNSAFLSAWDAEAASAMYGSGVPTCSAVAITAHPLSASIQSGASRTLNVSVSGTGPFVYTWYQGSTGDEGTPVDGPDPSTSTSDSFTTPPLSATTSYWVRVTNCEAANSASSNTATLTLSCSASITQQPQSQSLPQGSDATLSVGVGTGSYTYQWYLGSSGNTADPIAGATSSTLNTGSLSTTTSYWVLVTRTNCPSPSSIESDTATISICQIPEMIDEPQDQTVVSGSGTTLTVFASGTSISYQWYRGASGTTSNRISGATKSSYSTGSLSATSTYWVRITNNCGGLRNLDSRTVTVTVVAQCVAPVITAQPQSTTVNNGGSATLSVAATGTALLYQWFEGQAGDTSKPVGTNSASYGTGSLTQTKSYWVRLTNSCGQLASQTATVTVKPPCPAGALCTLNGKFELSLAVRDHRTGTTGAGAPLQQNDIFGYFSLPSFTGDPNNPEVFVKMLDGRPVTGSYWTFFGGLTDLEYTLSVKDTETSQTKTYFKAGGNSNGGFDVGGGVTPETCKGETDGTVLPSEAPSTCVNLGDRLCLNDSRFRVELNARDPRTGATAQGAAIPQGNIFGYFSIPSLTGNASNPEVFVKIIDARSFVGYFWVFYSGLTDLEYTMTVTDTVTGARKAYTKAPFSACGAFDTKAFPGN